MVPRVTATGSTVLNFTNVTEHIGVQVTRYIRGSYTSCYSINYDIVVNDTVVFYWGEEEGKLGHLGGS